MQSSAIAWGFSICQADGSDGPGCAFESGESRASKAAGLFNAALRAIALKRLPMISTSKKLTTATDHYMWVGRLALHFALVNGDATTLPTCTQPNATVLSASVLSSKSIGNVTLIGSNCHLHQRQVCPIGLLGLQERLHTMHWQHCQI